MSAMPNARSSRSPLAALALAAACARAAREPGSAADLTSVADGEVRWTVTYDEAARADGAVDCGYARQYTAIQDRSAPWTCPACTTVLASSASMSDADAACYRALAGVDPAPVERIGWSEDQFFRSTYPFGPMGPTADLLVAPPPPTSPAERVDPPDVYDVVFASEVDLPRAAGPGSAHIAVEGALEVAVAPGDPWSGMTPPEVYTCGWRRLDAPPYTGPWTLSLGALAPDGWFVDPCGQPVRLHDFAGGYVVVDIAAPDCGPCQAMAADEDAFLAEVRALGIPIDVVTLLVSGLSTPFEEGPVELLDEWRDAFALESPVLADRGWGGVMALSLWPDVLSYPSWVVLSPSLEVVGAGKGYGTYDPIRDSVVADAARTR